MKGAASRVAPLLLACVSFACASAPLPPAVEGGGGVRVRTAADDRLLVRVVPLGPETVVELDMSQLRSSPWSRQLVGGLQGEEQQARLNAVGYDEVADVDRVVFAISETGAEPQVLTLSQGRFSQDRVAGAFAGGGPPAPPTLWRGSPVWQSGERAIAFVTPRTLAAGPAPAVRAAIDCAYGVVPDVLAAELGTLRRALDAERGSPAVLAVVTVGDSLRARVGGEFEVPAGLRRVGARLDLGQPLHAVALGTFDDPREATAAARTLDARLTELRRRPALRVLGLTPLLDGAAVGAQGSRVRASLHLPEDKRDELAQRIGVVLEALVKARAR